LISITPDYDIKISPRIQQAYFNGKAYYRLDNQKLTNLPEQRELWPHRDKLAEHYETRFQR
jgi:putative restriction endonuclease